MFDKDDFGTLAGIEADPAVSLFLPTHTAGREIRQDPIRLKDLLGEAERKLVDGGMRPEDAAGFLAPARRLLEDEAFWRRQAQGLALFIAPKVFRCQRLPIELPEIAVVGRRFHLKPLLPMFAADGSFYVLTVTAGQVRIFEGSRFGMVERSDADLPQSVEEIFAESDYELTQHASPVARPRAAGPGGVPRTQGLGDTPEALRKKQLALFLRQVAVAADDWLGSSGTPVVLVAAPEIQGHFRAVSQIAGLLPEGIDANPEGLAPEEVHRRAYALVCGIFERDRSTAIEQFQMLFGDPGRSNATVRLEEIVRAARFGRVDKLLIDREGAVWGRFDEAADRVDTHDSPEPGDEDLLDYATVQTLLRGGQVYLVDQEELPPGATMAAVLRY